MKSLKIALIGTALFIIAPLLAFPSMNDFSDHYDIFLTFQKILYSIFVLSSLALFPAGFRILNQRILLITLVLLSLILTFFIAHSNQNMSWLYTAWWIAVIIAGIANDYYIKRKKNLQSA